MDMNSAKFLALCFGLMTVISVSIIPMLSVLSAVMCAAAGWRSTSKGVDNKGYIISATIILLMAISVCWKMQNPYL